MSGSFAYLTNVPFYECTITATARDYDPQGGEMYQITLDLKQKPATIEHFFLLKKTIISLCTDAPLPLEKKWGEGGICKQPKQFSLAMYLWKNYAISARTQKTVIFALEFSFFKISSLHSADPLSQTAPH